MILMPAIPGVTKFPVKAWNGKDIDDVETDDEEWFIEGGWNDATYEEYASLYHRFLRFGNPWSCGWLDWPYQGYLILDLFARLDSAIERL